MTLQTPIARSRENFRGDIKDKEILFQREGYPMNDIKTPVQTDTAAELMGRVAWKIIKIPAMRKTAVAIVHEALKDWSGDSKLKMRMSENIEETIEKVLASNETAGSNLPDDINYAELLRPEIRELIEHIDFGEVKAAVDASNENVAAIVRMVNEEIWRYPAKVICILSMLPAAANVTVSATKEILTPINALAPDLLADVILSLVDDIDGKNIGKLINQLSELVRKLHTGSTLIGDPGKPQIPNTLSRLTHETLSTLDISLLLKAKTLFSEIKELSLITFIDLLEQSPELSREFFQNHFLSMVSLIRNWSRKADAFERLFSDADIAREFARGMGEIDAQEVADTISRMCAIVNRVRAVTPGIIRNTLSQAINSVDADEVGETVRWFTEDVVESLKPVASEVLPPLIRGIADLLRPDPAGGSREIQEALVYLKDAINNKEAVV
jgi:hypothetical protein